MKFYLFGSIPLILLVVFITLKLLKVISWSWWWITAPAWVPLVLIVLLGIFVVYVLRKEENKDWYI